MTTELQRFKTTKLSNEIWIILGIADYKWRVDELYSIQTDVFGYDLDLPFLALNKKGILSLKPGYCYNGASGPTWDTPSCRRASGVHDAWYQLFKMGLVDLKYKPYADGQLRDLAIEDGMWEFRAKGWHWGVDTFGASHARPDEKKRPDDSPIDYEDSDHG